MYICTYVYSVFKIIIYACIYFFEVTLHSNFRSHKLSNKSLSQCQARVGWGEFRRPPKQRRLLSLLLVACQNIKVRPHCRRHHTLQTQDLKKSSWRWPGSLFPRALSLVSGGVMRAPKGMGESYQLPDQAVKPENPNNDQTSETAPKVHQWHCCLGSNQQLSDWASACSVGKNSYLVL